LKEQIVSALAKMKQQQLGDIVIRLATEADAATIATIRAASWRDAYAHILAPQLLSRCIEENRLAVWSQRLRDHPPAQLAFDLTGEHRRLFVAFVILIPSGEALWIIFTFSRKLVVRV
jgi:hypothetical protein